MDSVMQTILSSPYIVMGIAIVIFIISLISLVKRIFGFFATLIVLSIALISGYTIINYELVHDAIVEWHTGTKKDNGAIDTLEHKIETNIEEVKQYGGNLIEKMSDYLDEEHKSEPKPTTPAPAPKPETK